MADLVFIQMSDLHTMPEAGATIHDDAGSWLIDPDANLRLALDHIRAMQIRPAFVLVSGDLVNEATEASYRRLRDEALPAIAALGAPVLLGLGNHDRRGPFRRVVLGESDGRDDELYCYARTIGALRVLMLDSTNGSANDGRLGGRQLAWLDEQLRAPAPGGDLVVFHHPVVLPDLPGFPSRTSHVIADAEALAGVIAGRPVLGILTAHVHISSVARFGDALTASSPCVSYLMDRTRHPVGVVRGAGFNLCAVRDGRLFVQPTIVTEAPPIR